MFGNLPITPNFSAVNPKDIPEPTEIYLPAYQPIATDDSVPDDSVSLLTLLEGSGRETTGLGRTSLSALGVHLTLDASIRDLLPPEASVPDFARWETYTSEQAREHDRDNEARLRTTGPAPGCHVYLERRKELANTNEEAFRTVRRLTPPKGKQQARLGNAYEFFRCLEHFTGFWDDTSQSPELPPSPELTASEAVASQTSPESGPEEHPVCMRTSSGASMPAHYRQSLLNAFIKFVAYDFGCNVSVARIEPKLYVQSPPGEHHRKSQTPSNCQFVFQSPVTREAARAGIVCGPVAAVSARASIDFTIPNVEAAQSLDLAREMVAALITAQHRNREGKKEVRFGDGKWWTTKPRWGGGVGGPIGREIEKFEKSEKSEKSAAITGDGDSSSAAAEQGLDGPASKKVRKNLPMYDNYRMVRPPAPTWDKKARYEAVGKVPDAPYDDIFVFSSLFHHMSILRVRVPTRLLEVLDGSPEPDATKRSWGKIEAWRSPWYDFFKADQRMAAMQTIWAVMAHQMRSNGRETGLENYWTGNE
ncbi:hypothetical protein E4U25_006667 [Claviceps purpurea]|nr:hypothetical protein E4U25_006667 [Claviceps purpurea]